MTDTVTLYMRSGGRKFTGEVGYMTNALVTLDLPAQPERTVPAPRDPSGPRGGGISRHDIHYPAAAAKRIVVPWTSIDHLEYA